MDDKNTIIELTKAVVSIHDKVDEILDGIPSELFDVFDAIGELTGPAKALIKATSLTKRLKFKKFLISYAKSINHEAHIDEQFFKKLEKYLKKESNLQFIGETIDSAT